MAASKNGIERSIGRLEGKLDALVGSQIELKDDFKDHAEKLDRHIEDERHDFSDLRKVIGEIKNDVLVGKVQRRMVLLLVGGLSGVVSALATLKATLGKIWPG